MPSTFKASFILIIVESEESNVVPLINNELICTSPVPLGCMLKLAFDPFAVITFVVKLSAVTPSLKVDVPVTANVELKVAAPVTPSVLDKVAAPVTARVDPIAVAPVISTVSAMVIFVESDESSVVPFTLKELKTTSPVPLGCIEISALDPFDCIEFVIKLSAVTPSLKVDVPVTAKVLDKVVAPVTATVEVAVTAPSILVAPFICKPSATVIKEESSELKVVPAILKAEATIPPVPFGVITMSSFDLEETMLNPLISKLPPN